MADSTDFDIDLLRWAILTNLTRAANIVNPSSSEKDVGYVLNARPDSGPFNQRAAEIYVGLQLITGDFFPQLEPWNGLLPGQSTLVLTGSIAGVTTPTARYLFDDALLTVQGGLEAVPLNNTGMTRLDRLAVEIDAVTGVGTYVVVTGTTSLPTLAGNQRLIADFEVANGSSTPTNIVTQVFQAAERRPARNQIARFTAASVTRTTTDADTVSRVTQSTSSVALGASGRVGIELGRLPFGATVTGVNVHVDPRTGNTDFGMQAEYRYYDVGTGAMVTPASASNAGNALTGSRTILSFAVGSSDGLISTDRFPEVSIIGDAANPLASSGDAPVFRAVEVLYNLPT